MKKKHLAALLSALVIPGAGQLYSRHFLKGAALLCATLAVFGSVIYKTWSAAMAAAVAASPEPGNIVQIAQSVVEGNRGFYNTLIAISFFIWLIGIIDAWATGGAEPVGSRKGRDVQQMKGRYFD